MRAVLVFCEGRHDVLFVQRSLGTLRDCEFMRAPIRDLPTPLGDSPQGEGKSLILRSYESRPMTESRIGAAAEFPPFPILDAVLLAPDEHLFVLLRCGSDSQHEPVVNLLSNLDVALSSFPQGRWDIERYAVAFFYDADEAGADARLERARERFEGHFGSLQGLQVGQWVHTDTVPVGCFVFHDPASGKGALEAYVAPLVEAEWPDRWKAAVDFIDGNKQAGDRVSRGDTERWKALITATGQFDFPGHPMTSVLDHRGLPRDCFRTKLCQDLVQFLTDVPW